jgi:hypothetical protein
MHQRFLLGVASLALLAVALVDAAEPSPEPVVKAAKDFIPTRKYAPLEGTRVGILVSKVQDIMGRDGRSGPPDAMGFSTGDNSYRWVYWPVTEKPLITNLQVEVGLAGGKKKVYPSLSMANAPLVKAKGIEAAYALVEVKVNDGEGAPAGEGFVATDMTRLDDTKKYPLKLPTVVEGVQKAYKTHFDGQKKAIETALDNVQKKVVKGRKVTGPRESKEIMYLTWLPEKERVRIAFITRVSDGAYTQVDGGGARPLPLPALPPRGAGLVAFFPPPPPRNFKVRIGVTFGVELGMAYEIDVKGKTVATEELPIKSFSQELAPPPGGRLRGGFDGLRPRK